MTRHKSFKQRVRDRMTKTGERYTTARRQLLGHTAPDAEPPSYAGVHAATTAFRLLLRHAGHAASERTLLAAGGGVGIGVFAFHYEHFSSLFLAGRHLWHDDLAFLQGLAGRFDCTLEVRETSGRKKAERDLFEMLEHGPVVAFVDLGTLGHRGPVEAYYLVTVLDADPEAGTARIADLADAPLEVPLATLADARAKHRKFAHRLMRIERAPSELPWSRAVADGLWACAEGLVASPMKGFGRNFTLDGLDDLVRRMRGGGKDGWETVFPPGPRRWAALSAVYEYVEHYGTGGGLLRPFFASALRGAARHLNTDARRAADAYAALGEAWSDAAAHALTDEVPAFARLKGLIDDTYATYYAQEAGANEALEDLRRRRAELTGGEDALNGGDAAAHLEGLADRVANLAEAEREARARLVEALGDG